MRKPLFLLAAISIALFASASLQAAPVAITAPPNNSTIQGDGVEIVISMNSTDKLPVSRVEVSLDGQLVTKRSYTPSISTGDSVFKWDTTRTPNGKHTLNVGVFSDATLVGTASCQVTVSNAATTINVPSKAGPKVLIKSPKDGQVISGTTPIVIDAFADGGDPFVSIYVDKSIRSAGNVRPFQYYWNTTLVENGPHYIAATVTDTNDASKQSPTIRVIVRNPVVRIPIAAQSQSNLPLLPSIKSSPTVSLPSPGAGTNATPQATAALPENSREVARSDSQTPSTTESFEVAQGAGQKPTSLKPAQPSSTLAVQLPPATALPAAAQTPGKIEQPAAAKLPTTSAVNKAATQPLPSSTASAPTLQPSLAVSGGIQVQTSASSANVLSVPSIPKAVAALPNGVAAGSSASPKLLDNTQGSALSTSAKSQAVLATPAIPAPVQGTTAVSAPATAPILMAKADTGDLATTSTKTNVLSTPSVPKPAVAKPVVAPKPTAQNSVLYTPAVSTAVQAKPAIIKNPKTQVAAAPESKGDNVVLYTPVASAPIRVAAIPNQTRTVTNSKPKAAVVTAPKVTAKVVKKPEAVKRAKVHVSKMVGIRPAIEKANGTIEWDNTAKTVHATAKQKDIKIKIGSSKAQVNSQSVNMGRVAVIRKSRTFVPEGFVKDTLGEK